MRYMLSALLVAWAGSAEASDCPKAVPPLETVLEADRAVNSLETGLYVPPERIAAVIHRVWLIEQSMDPSCRHSLSGWLADSRRRVMKKFEESLEKDAFLLEGNLALFERKLAVMERRIAAAEAEGWPAGAKDALATEYVGYYDGQVSELGRRWVELYAATRLVAAAEGWSRPPASDARADAAAVTLSRISPRVLRVEDSLGLRAPAAAPVGQPKLERMDAAKSKEAADRAFEPVREQPPHPGLTARRKAASGF